MIAFGILFGVIFLGILFFIVAMNSQNMSPVIARTIIIVGTVIGVLLGGYFGYSSMESGNYPSEKCNHCSATASPGYKVKRKLGFSTTYYCSNHKTYAEIAAGTYSSTNSSSRNDTDAFGHDKFDAHVAAKNIVEQNLKSPSTAKFCKTSECTITRNGNTWTVKGYVDAQNSFGATLRSNYTVKFTFISDNRYTIDSCYID